MAEIPEIAKYAGQMDAALRGKTIAAVTILQEKCANLPVDEFDARTRGATVTGVSYRGKWIVTTLDNGESILLNYGMGADVLAFAPGAEDPEKYQIKVEFTDGSGYTARFWWFGMFHLARTDALDRHPSFKDVALDPFSPDFTPEHFARLLAGKRTQVKTFILDQKNVGGIGNMYAHDILFTARLHPRTKVSDLTAEQVRGLYDAIQSVLRASRDKGSFAWEKDFFGNPGGWGGEGSGDFQVGYRKGEPCPACATPIEEVKAGSSTSSICPACQPPA